MQLYLRDTLNLNNINCTSTLLCMLFTVAAISLYVNFFNYLQIFEELPKMDAIKNIVTS